jgi:hypothetical protein
MSYQGLNAEKIIASTELLSQRVQERFPHRGICAVCAELNRVANDAAERTNWISKPHWGLRAGIFFLIGVLSLAIIFALTGIVGWIEIGRVDLVSFLEAINNGISNFVFLGAGIFFFFSLENRVKRSRALTAMHELRSLAHVIDMHQLTKDPERLLQRGVSTPASPIVIMTTFELSRYLDYCSEMLSLIGKIAALYVQNFDDPVALSAVKEIEDLTTGLSRKIWQKIMVLHDLESDGRIPLVGNKSIDTKEQLPTSSAKPHGPPRLKREKNKSKT